LRPCWRNSMRALVLLVFLAIAASACATSESTEGEVVGIVTEVTGDLSSVESFVVLDSNGDSYKFIPGDGMTVMGSPPMHLRDHLISGEPVKVMYHEGRDSELIADDVVHG
jgi:hypothetical protein